MKTDRLLLDRSFVYTGCGKLLFSNRDNLSLFSGCEPEAYNLRFYSWSFISGFSHFFFWWRKLMKKFTYTMLSKLFYRMSRVLKNSIRGNAIPALGVKPKRMVRILVIFQDRPMFSHMVQQVSEGAFHWCGWNRSMLKNYQNTHFPRFSFIPKTAFPQTGILFLLLLSTANALKAWDGERTRKKRKNFEYASAFSARIMQNTEGVQNHNSVRTV